MSIIVITICDDTITALDIPTVQAFLLVAELESFTRAAEVLGTTQAAMVYFFSDYAAGATADDRAAMVLAFAIVHFVYAVLAQLVIGAVCAPFARRIRAPQPGPAAA